ncbi:MAG: PAS domain S-box protein [Cyanobacteria bacterium]|nr:PAS domain S-box protein [Cyanobacteriota bacterium]MDA0866871.1 PAS domain S-box protein [Cyanobacteriota bacterium]
MTPPAPSDHPDYQPTDYQPTGHPLLIVHADGDNAIALSQLLSDRGYEAAVTNPDPDLPKRLVTDAISLLFIDISPQSGDSFTLCQYLKAEPTTRDIPIMMVGEGDATEAVKAFESGSNDYIAWPCHGGELQARVRNQLNLSQQRQQLRQQNALLLDEVKERTQIEAALRQTEAQYRSIFENATEGIFQTSEAGRYLQVNPALAQIYGYDSPQDVLDSISNVGKQLYVQPKRRDELVAYLRQFGNITGAESEIFRKDGSRIWVSETLHKVKDSYGNFLYYEGIVHDITERRSMEMELRQQRKQADRLLINILPFQIAQRLKSGVRTIAEDLDNVTVLFADLVEFTAASRQMTPKELVELLNNVFSTFDRLAEHYGLEKIKTIGDAYMVAGGLSRDKGNEASTIPKHIEHLQAVAAMALDMRQAIGEFHRPDGTPFQLRVGIHIGPVMAGVIGRRKFAYDLWGDTVNIASRMESMGMADHIQVTPVVHEQLKAQFCFKRRGTIAIKGSGLMETYWLLKQR